MAGHVGLEHVEHHAFVVTGADAAATTTTTTAGTCATVATAGLFTLAEWVPLLRHQLVSQGGAPALPTLTAHGVEHHSRVGRWEHWVQSAVPIYALAAREPTTYARTSACTATIATHARTTSTTTTTTHLVLIS